ncbi:MAG: tetratricopeptide repeat protein, partial [Anaerolineae bacterium]|nr:tetratricopeptide repeat protein [Anaerolineae bacterium]
IRALLTEGFTPEQLRRFCYDTPEFRPVYDQLAQVTGKAAIIDHLIEHAERCVLFAPLLDWAKEENPAQYERYRPYESATAADQPAGHPSGGAQSRHRPSPLQRPRRAEHFTGREQELAQLLADLQPGQVVTLTGPGGIGKSALAAEAIWTLAPDNAPPDRFPDGIVFYSFYGQPDTALALEHLVRSFDDTARDSSPPAAYRLLSGKQALIILDGAEAAADLRAVLDVTASCGVLVTSRKRSDAVAAPQPINPLPEDEAVTLLRKWGGTQVDDETAAQDICRLVGGLPLAVRLVGRYLTANGEIATEYLTWLQETPLQALDQGQRRDDSVPYLIERSLAEVSVAANEVLAMTGLLALAPFSRAVVQAALPEVNTRRALGELVSYGLLLRNKKYYEASHILIYAYARERLQVPDNILNRLGDYYKTFVEEQIQLSGLRSYHILKSEYMHIDAIRKQSSERGILNALQKFRDALGNYVKLVKCYKGELEKLDSSHEAAAKLLYRNISKSKDSALNFWHSTDGMKTLEYLQDVLTISREIGDQRSEAISLINLANVYTELGQVEKAGEYLAQSAAIAKEIKSPDVEWVRELLSELESW